MLPSSLEKEKKLKFQTSPPNKQTATTNNNNNSQTQAPDGKKSLPSG